MSEIITNLANDILASADWYPSITHIPHYAQIPKPNILNNNISFAKSLPADIAVTPLKHVKVDCYINNLIPVILHSEDNAEQSANAVPLTMHIIYRLPSSPKRTHTLRRPSLFPYTLWKKPNGRNKNSNRLGHRHLSISSFSHRRQTISLVSINSNHHQQRPSTHNEMRPWLVA